MAEIDMVVAALIKESDTVAGLVKDPRGLAEEVCKAELMSRDEMDTLINDSTKDDNSKAREIVRHIGTEVSICPHLSPIASMILLKLPGMKGIIKAEPEYVDVDDTILGEEDAFAVKSAVLKLAARFRSLGLALGLPASKIDEIQNDNLNMVGKILQQIIDTWLAQQYNTEQFGVPSWRKLVSAVASPAGGNNHLLAKQLAEDHPVVHRERHLKSTEEPVEKCPRLESTIDDIPKLHQLKNFEHGSQTLKIIDRVAVKWKIIALRLHFEDHCIQVIERDYHSQSVEACLAMFTQWLEGKGRKPTTWKTLIVALEEANLHDVAEDLRNNLLVSFSWSHPSGSLFPSTSSQLIHPSQYHSLPGPSSLPSQGSLENYSIQEQPEMSQKLPATCSFAEHPRSHESSITTVSHPNSSLFGTQPTLFQARSLENYHIQKQLEIFQPATFIHAEHLQSDYGTKIYPERSKMVTPTLTSHELATLWEHFDQLVDAINDPDSLAEEACRVGLIHPESKKILQSLPFDAKTKARSLLQSIEGKIQGQPLLFHRFLALLKKLPGLTNLGVVLQNAHGKDVAINRVCDALKGKVLYVL